MTSYYKTRNEVYKAIDDFLYKAKKDNLLFKVDDLIRELVYQYPYSEKGMLKHLLSNFERDKQMRWDETTNEIWWDENERKTKDEINKDA